MQQHDNENAPLFSLYPVTNRSLSESQLHHVEAASRALRKQWPRGGSIADYRRKLLGLTLNSSNDVASSLLMPTFDNPIDLPCSFLLLRNDRNEFVAHGRLTACFEGAGGNAAAATYILADPRGQGYGTILMTLLEQEAMNLGYHYLYLWTTTAIPFYNKLGYSKTERVSLHSACLKTLHSDQVGSLEAMLAKRTTASVAGRSSSETVMLPPDAASENDVWLRKRLVEHVTSTEIPLESRIEELKAAIQQYTDYSQWVYFLHSIPWQQQVGPSCGLAALRMLRDYYCTNGNMGLNDPDSTPSLLAEAQSKLYTLDGEIFDARNIVHLARFCGLRAELHSLRQFSLIDILRFLKEGAALILPYDSQAYTRRPWKNGGKSAHYGIIVGVLLGHQAEEHVSEDMISSSLVEMSDIPKKILNIDCPLLVVQHSLSCKFSIAPYVDFFESNQQLISMDTNKCKLPNGGTLFMSDCVIICHGGLVEPRRRHPTDDR